jgi:hypothetical protein
MAKAKRILAGVFGVYPWSNFEYQYIGNACLLY